MIRAAAAACALALAVPGTAAETLGVLAVAEPPAGPDVDLAELAHQLRAACRDRVGGVEDVPAMRARLLGQASNATLSELDRAYGGALAVYQNGEFESALSTLRAIVEDLEALPETDDSYAQWIRAQLRLAHADLTLGLDRDAEAVFLALARTDPGIRAEADQYSPTYRKRLEQAKAKARALPTRRLTVTAEGPPGAVFVNGRRMGTTPLTIELRAGRYRIGGAAGSLRVPSFSIDLESEDRSVVLDLALAASLRVNAGPGLALDPARRGDGIVRAGAWLGTDRVIAVSRASEGQAQFLLGSIYDVRRGALSREGSVRMVAGSVPSVNLAALASFLLTGQSSPDVKVRTAGARAAPVAAERKRRRDAPPETVQPAALVARAEGTPEAAAPAVGVTAAPERGHDARPSTQGGPPAGAAPPTSAIDDVSADPSVQPSRTRSPRSTWLRRGALVSGGLAAGFAALTIQQGLAAKSAYDEARSMEASATTLNGDPDRYRALIESGDDASRNAYISAGAAVVFAAAAGVLGWSSRERPPEPGLTFRF